MKAACFLLLLGAAIVAAEEISVDKVDHDVHLAARALKSSNVDHATKTAQLKNLKEMDRDLKAYAHATPAHRREIGQDLHNRMSTIKRILEGTSTRSLEKETTKTAKVVPHRQLEEISNDVSNLRRALEKSSVSASVKREMEENLSAIMTNAQKISETSSQEVKDKLHQAIELRVKAFKTAVQSKPSELKAGAVPRVTAIAADVEKLRAQLASSSMSSDLQREMEENLKTIQKDAARFSTSNEAEKEKLRQAMKLRVQALHEALSAPIASNPIAADNTAVLNDIAQFQGVISKSDLPAASRRDLSEQLDKIRSQAIKLSSAPKTSRASLITSMKSELSSIKKALTSVDSHTESHTGSFEETSQIVKDVQNVRASLRSITVPAVAEKQISNNLDSIEKDARDIATAGESRKESLKQALKLRVAALRRQLEEGEGEAEIQSPVGNSSSSVDAAFLSSVTSKLEELKASIWDLNLSAATKTAVDADLHEMEQDLASIKEGHNVKNLKKALNLRFSALRQMLGDAEDESL